MFIVDRLIWFQNHEILYIDEDSFCCGVLAIERCKQEISDNSIEYRHGQSECSEQTSSEGHVFEEFIPLKRSSFSDSDNDEELEESDHHRNKTNDKDKSNSGDKKKSDWLRSVQLWNTTPDVPQKEVLKIMQVLFEQNCNWLISDLV